MTSQTENITDSARWDELVQQHQEANFLQSWSWGMFHEQLGKTVYRLAITSADATTYLAEVVIERARRGDYAAVYGGPLGDWSNTKALLETFAAIKELAVKHKCSFIRFRPQQEKTGEVSALLKLVGAKPAPMHLTADLTLQLPLESSDEELKAQMRKNHRYYIKRADRDGITTRVSTDPADLKEFYKWQLYLAEKQHFVPFAEQYLTEQFEIFSKHNDAFLVHAEKDGQLLASTFIISYNQEAVYHYGISTPLNEKQPGSYAALWCSIQESKARGCRRFNFWGIAPEDDENHRFSGVSLFKRGFGGNEVAYLPAHDIPLSKSYWLTYIFETLRKKSRGL